jgi:hypothetical protein
MASHWGHGSTTAPGPLSNPRSLTRSAPWMTFVVYGGTPSRLTLRPTGGRDSTPVIRIDCVDAHLWPGFFNGWRSAPRTIPATSPLDKLCSSSVALALPTLPAGVVSRRFRNVLASATCGGLRATPDCRIPGASSVMFVRDVEAVWAGGQAIIQRRCQPGARFVCVLTTHARAASDPART